MAWAISISGEGWNDIYQSLHQLTPTEELVKALSGDDYEAWEEYESEESDDDSDSTPRPEPDWDKLKARYKDLSHETLADAVYERIQEHNTCDNGGGGYWMDRQGYHRLYPERFNGERIETEEAIEETEESVEEN